MVRITTVINWISLPISIVVSVLSIQHLFTTNWDTCECYISKILTANFNVDYSSEGKVKFLVKALSYTSIFTLANVLLTMLSRIITIAAYPHAEKDNSFVSIWVKTIQNTLEHSFIFYSLLGYWLFNVSVDAKDGKLAVLLVFIFLVSRVSLGVGLFLETVFSIKILRLYGNLIGLISYFIILSKTYNHPSFQPTLHYLKL